jgi:phosphatidylglycerol:prolipoprotein diacylglycerol transferase
MLGVVVATILYCRRQGIPVFGFGDRIAMVAPIGLGLGRIANFLLASVLAVERVLIRLGIRFPAGGSLLLVARRI